VDAQIPLRQASRFASLDRFFIPSVLPPLPLDDAIPTGLSSSFAASHERAGLINPIRLLVRLFSRFPFLFIPCGAILSDWARMLMLARFQISGSFFPSCYPSIYRSQLFPESNHSSFDIRVLTSSSSS